MRAFTTRSSPSMQFANTDKRTATLCPARLATSVAGTPPLSHRETAAWRRSYGRARLAAATRSPRCLRKHAITRAYLSPAQHHLRGSRSDRIRLIFEHSVALSAPCRDERECTGHPRAELIR